MFAQKLNDIGIRKYGKSIDSASSPEQYSKDPAGNQKLIVETFKEAAKIAGDHVKDYAEGAYAGRCMAGKYTQYT